MDKIIVLDFGGQYCHLIARRIRDMGVLAQVVPSDTPARIIKKDQDIKGIILSGGAQSVYDKNAPRFDKTILQLGIPILGICYGHQLIAHVLKGKVIAGKVGEYGVTSLGVVSEKGLLAGVSKVSNVWMNHRDIVQALPKDFLILAKTDRSPIEAFSNLKRNLFGVQFHPEVSHTTYGGKILRNFAIEICQCKSAWSAKTLVKQIVEEAAQTLGNAKAIIGLSGGIDSSVAAALVSKAIGNKLVAVYVDTGLMRDEETRYIKKVFSEREVKLIVVNAAKEFFGALKGVTLPERKRKIIGKLFAKIFLREAKRARAQFLIQGTIYSDRIESGITKYSSTIKSHHNVGGLPKRLGIKLYEPLRELYKDEVRNLGKELRLPKEITTRQVFPGPGLAIRIIGEVTPAKAKIVRQASAIIEEELKNTKFWPQIWMSFAVLLPIKSVGIQGDARSYKYPIVLRIVESRDAMTANFSKLPFELLEKISTRITNEVSDVNRVVYDITNKPPGTMEWE